MRKTWTQWLHIALLGLTLTLAGLALASCGPTEEDHRGDKVQDEIDPNIYPIKN